jgi:hypothetical protein
MTARDDLAAGRRTEAHALSWGERWAALAIISLAASAAFWAGGAATHQADMDVRLSTIEAKVDKIDGTVTGISIALARIAPQQHAEAEPR